MLKKADFIELNKNMLEIVIRTEIMSLIARRKVSEGYIYNLNMVIETEMLTAQIDRLEISLADVRSYD